MRGVPNPDSRACRDGCDELCMWGMLNSHHPEVSRGRPAASVHRSAAALPTDRLDLAEDKTLHVVDYKTGRATGYEDLSEVGHSLLASDEFEEHVLRRAIGVAWERGLCRENGVVGPS